jgi:hypothetical protein
VYGSGSSLGAPGAESGQLTSARSFEQFNDLGGTAFRQAANFICRQCFSHIGFGDRLSQVPSA